MSKRAGGQPPGSVRRTVTIINERGLHARAAAKFVKLAEAFDAEITVSREGNSVSGVSIMGLMMLAATPGTQLDISAVGPEARPAVEALVTLIEKRFDED